MFGVVENIWQGNTYVAHERQRAQHLVQHLGKDVAAKLLPGMCKMAGCGVDAGGGPGKKVVYNIARDFARRTRAWRGVDLSLSWTMLPLIPLKKEGKKQGDVAWQKWPIIHPGQLINATYRGSRKRFEKVFHARPGACNQVWDAIGKTPWGAHHPVQKLQPEQREKAMGYVLHGDCFRHYKRQKMCAVSMRSFLAKGCPWSSRNLLILLPASRMFFDPNRLHESTIYVMQQRLVELLEQLNLGVVQVVPTVKPANGWDKDMQGSEIAGGWTFHFLGLTGDLEWKAEVLLWSLTGRYHLCNWICNICMALSIIF